LCWYRQQSTIKVTSNSDGYGTKRLPARGTRHKIQAITITYAADSIPDFFSAR
jgi:hypothetical protein